MRPRPIEGGLELQRPHRLDRPRPYRRRRRSTGAAAWAFFFFPMPAPGRHGCAAVVSERPTPGAPRRATIFNDGRPDPTAQPIRIGLFELRLTKWQNEVRARPAASSRNTVEGLRDPGP